MFLYGKCGLFMDIFFNPKTQKKCIIQNLGKIPVKNQYKYFIIYFILFIICLF